MAERIELNYEQELILETRAITELQTLRSVLRSCLEERFGAVPEGLAVRIDAADADRLRVAVRQVVRINTPDDLQL